MPFSRYSLCLLYLYEEGTEERNYAVLFHFYAPRVCPYYLTILDIRMKLTELNEIGNPVSHDLSHILLYGMKIGIQFVRRRDILRLHN